MLAIGVLGGGAGMAGPSVLMAATAPDRARAPRHRHRHRQCRQFVRSVPDRAAGADREQRCRMGCRGSRTGRDDDPARALPAAWCCGGVQRRCAARPERIDDHRRRGRPKPRDRPIARAAHDRNFLLLRAGFFVCPGSRRLHRHPPARRRRLVQPAGLLGAWALRRRRPVQHRGQPGMGWGGRALAHEIAAVAGLCRAPWSCSPSRRPKTEATMLAFAAALWPDLPLDHTAHRGPGRQVLHGTANMATLFGIAMLSHQVGGFSAPTSAARPSRDRRLRLDVVRGRRPAIGAALVNLPIREAAPVRQRAVAHRRDARAGAVQPPPRTAARPGSTPSP